jgi:hypothetical protein
MAPNPVAMSKWMPTVGMMRFMLASHIEGGPSHRVQLTYVAHSEAGYTWSIASIRSEPWGRF